MRKSKWSVFVLAGVMLAACSGDGGTSREELLKLAGESTLAPAATAQGASPTPPVTVEQAQRVITQWATVIVRETVEVTVTPDIVMACDPRTPAPTMALDASDIDAGVVVKGAAPCGEVLP